MQSEVREILLEFQRSEITEHEIYKRLAQKTKGKNREVLEHIANDELGHYRVWKRHTGVEVPPNRFKVWFYLLVAKIFGLTFAIKMMEAAEKEAEEVYEKVREVIPNTDEILKDELRHENELIQMIDEEKIGYIGSMVLGLNDALVELTGTLAGLTFALRNTRIVGIAGVITGIAASLSMAASEYLSRKSEAEEKSPAKAAFYTGVAYVITVMFLVMPYFIFTHYMAALGLTIFNVILIILLFTFFVSVVKSLSFRKLFIEMVTISLGVAIISFLIGWGARIVLGVEID